MRNGAVLWGNMAQHITRPKAFQRKSTQRRTSLLSAASNLHSHKNGRKVENSAGSSCDDYRWEWMIQPSRNTPTISQTERNNNGSVWFMQPDEDFQIHAKHAKKVVGRMQKISSMTGSQLGLNIYFYFFFFNFLCICLAIRAKTPIPSGTHWQVRGSVSVGSQAIQKALQYLQRHVSE